MPLWMRKLWWLVKRPKNSAQVAERLWHCGCSVEQAWRVVDLTGQAIGTRDPRALWREVKQRGWTRGP